MLPLTIPIGIPIIRPKPTINEGAKAISGFPAREKSIMKSSVPSSSRGFQTRLTRKSGTGKIKFPVAGMIAARFIVTIVSTVEITEMI